MWQTLETKQSFIQQVMCGNVTVREAEDLESGALSFAEIKAIASGNPLVMEKVRIDTEVRKLDMLKGAVKLIHIINKRLFHAFTFGLFLFDKTVKVTQVVFNAGYGS